MSRLSYATAIVLLASSVTARKFTFKNSCSFTIYKDHMVSQAGEDTCATLESGQSQVVESTEWMGGLAAASTKSCDGLGMYTTTGLTRAEWSTNDADLTNSWDVSMITGMNLPMRITSDVKCGTTECLHDFMVDCPEALRNDGLCKGAGMTPVYTIVNGSVDVGQDAPTCGNAYLRSDQDAWKCPAQVQPYYDALKSLCPYSYIYPDDDSWPNLEKQTALATCTGQDVGNLLIEWCPNGVGSKSFGTGSAITDTSASGTYKANGVTYQADYSKGGLVLHGASGISATPAAVVAEAEPTQPTSSQDTTSTQQTTAATQVTPSAVTSAEQVQSSAKQVQSSAKASSTPASTPSTQSSANAQTSSKTWGWVKHQKSSANQQATTTAEFLQQNVAAPTVRHYY